jgi:hypothetical protein
MNQFSIGEQPCKEYKGQIECNGYAEWTNEHACFGFRQHKDGAPCNSTVSFCENCYYDHHANGYDTCGKEEVTL